MDNWLEQPVATLAAAVASHQVTPATLSEQALASIARDDGWLHAWAASPAGQARRAAACVDIAAAGALCGVPIGVKDVIDTADLPTAYGSSVYTDFRPTADAACVQQARLAGAVLLGKTVTAEFALASPGRTRNPLNRAHTPGGSSSGSAAAVAAGMVPLALATQTGGSIIRPATYCGIVGYKPSFGWIERTGVKPLAPSLDTLGVMARRVGDAAYFTAVLAQRRLDPAPASRLLRIGRYDPSSWSKLAPAADQALRIAALAFAASGARLTDRPAPLARASWDEAQQTIVLWEIGQTLANERERHLSRLRLDTRRVLALPAPSRQAYAAALDCAATARRSLDELFDDCDVLLAPAVPDLAPRGIRRSGDPSHCLLWTMLHTPCISVPVTRHPNGLAMGVQLIARIDDDVRLLDAARLLEAALAMPASIESPLCHH